ncbi:flagellar brake protein [Methylomicrobium album]|uniref:Flagellar brake protein YcgR n=1 Tax=Methylomicrobium album BG8 TaxID=686340 RepID=H8GFW9_METAL|nr:flagellar brake protein [Methylomicrobium album]EIC28720.1 putative glycosyltransferase [Methylomicrobium album BG8]
MFNDTDYMVHNKSQILNHLTSLFKKKCLILLSFDKNGTFVTTLAAIEPQKDLLLFDCAPSEHLNSQVLSASQVEFNSNFSGIKVHFQGKNIRKTHFDGETVFSMPIPKSIEWVQRRQFYRIRLPLLRSTLVKLFVDDQFLADMPLYDISISGFSLINDISGLSHFFEIGRKFSGCRLVLENAFNQEIEFQVVNVVRLNPNQHDSAQKIGCRFIGLRPAAESGIQLYMQYQERKNLSKKT